MTKLSPKQEKLLKEVRKNAEEVLKLCNQAEQGQISGEEFEKRCSKAKLADPFKLW